MTFFFFIPLFCLFSTRFLFPPSCHPPLRRTVPPPLFADPPFLPYNHWPIRFSPRTFGFLRVGPQLFIAFLDDTVVSICVTAGPLFMPLIFFFFLPLLQLRDFFSRLAARFSDAVLSSSMRRPQLVAPTVPAYTSPAPTFSWVTPTRPFFQYNFLR